MKKTSAFGIAAAVGFGLAAVVGLGVSAPESALAQTTTIKAPFKVSVRRTTESQYRHTIADVFGPDIKVNARFEPEKREGGLLAIGSAELSLTSSGFEQYFALAQSVGEQVVDEKNRTRFLTCQPKDAKAADDACAATVIRAYGDKLFRRPLTNGELAARVAAANKSATASKDFYTGLKMGVASLLTAPEFVFRVEVGEPDPAKAGQYRLDGYSKAARLSYLMWDTTPDAELLAAAKSGSLHTAAGLQAQVDRLAASKRFEDGARAFFEDMLQLDGFGNLTKDPVAYPKFSQAIADGAKEQTLMTAVDLLVKNNRDYRDLFTSNDTFLNRNLASVYKVPFASSTEWTPYSFPASSERAGILTQISFLSLFSHPAASSPTKRGVKVHEIFMCEATPEPPADVDFSKVQALANGTVRTRLLAHMENEGCAVCHRRSDPPGLALEHFDGLGQLRTMENGQRVDVSADLDGKKLDGAVGLGQYMHDSPLVPSCLVRNVYAYGVGHEPDMAEEDYLADQTKAFTAAGYKVPALIKQIAISPEFMKAKPPAGLQASAQPTSQSPAQTSKSSGGLQ